MYNVLPIVSYNLQLLISLKLFYRIIYIHFQMAREINKIKIIVPIYLFGVMNLHPAHYNIIITH